MPAGAMAVFDVTAANFGAVGDFDPSTGSGTDNHAAIGRAMGAVAANGGGVLYFPAGHYLSSGGATESTGTVINLVSNTRVVFDPAAALSIQPGITTPYFFVRAVDVRNVSIVGARFFGAPNPSLAAVQAHGILLKGAEDVTIRDCALFGLRHDGIYVGGGPDAPSRRVCIADTRAIGCGRNGLRIAHGRDVLVTRCEFSGTGGIPEEAGADIEPETGNLNSDIRFIGNLCAGNRSSGLTISSRPTQQGITVVGNTFADNTTHGLICGAPGVVLHGNLSWRNRASGLKLQSPDVSVVGNSLCDNGILGVNFAATATDCLVFGNRFARNAGGSVDTDYGEGTVITRNAGIDAGAGHPGCDRRSGVARCWVWLRARLRPRPRCSSARRWSGPRRPRALRRCSTCATRTRTRAELRSRARGATTTRSLDWARTIARRSAGR